MTDTDEVNEFNEPILIKIEIPRNKRRKCGKSCKKQCIGKPYTIFDHKPPRQKTKRVATDPIPASSDSTKKSEELAQRSKNIDGTQDSSGKLIKAPSTSQSIASSRTFAGTSPSTPAAPVKSNVDGYSEFSLGENRSHPSRQESLTLTSTRILIKPAAEESSSREQLYDNVTSKSQQKSVVFRPDMSSIEKTSSRPDGSAMERSDVYSKETAISESSVEEKPTRSVRVSIVDSKIREEESSAPEKAKENGHKASGSK